MQVTASFYYGVKVDITKRFDLVFEQNTAICVCIPSFSATELTSDVDLGGWECSM